MREAGVLTGAHQHHVLAAGVLRHERRHVVHMKQPAARGESGRN
jgi:hypothetical protein